MILESAGDVTVAVWEPAHVAPSHAELAMTCGRAILRNLQNEQAKAELEPIYASWLPREK
jgi:NADH dehydrogenase FAD-containing subunit